MIYYISLWVTLLESTGQAGDVIYNTTGTSSTQYTTNNLYTVKVPAYKRPTHRHTTHSTVKGESVSRATYMGHVMGENEGRVCNNAHAD